MLTPLGLSLADWHRLQAAGPVAPPKSCILIWLDGGPSHLDTFDPKPDAPSEVRSQFKPIGTSVEGLQICEHLPLTAKAMRDVALIRTIAMLGACCVLYLTPMVFHQAQFSLHDGSVACGPATEPAKTWPVKVEGGRVFLQL